MLCDTDVLVWYLRGNSKAGDVIHKLSGFSVSMVTYAELIQGMRSKVELTALRRQFAEWSVRIIPINESVSSRALMLVETFYHSHALQLSDALIAATAISNGLPLLTGNIKHYSTIKDLDIVRFKP